VHCGRVIAASSAYKRCSGAPGLSRRQRRGLRVRSRRGRPREGRSRSCRNGTRGGAARPGWIRFGPAGVCEGLARRPPGRRRLRAWGDRRRC